MSALAGNQLGYSLIRQVERLYSEGSRVEVLSFVQNVSRPHTPPPFTSLGINEIYDYQGVAVATSVSTAATLLASPGPSLKLFYVWDLEWMRGAGSVYEDLADVYRKIPLVARSDDHARLIEDCWNVGVSAVVEECNLTKFIKIARTKSGEAKVS